MSQNQQTRRTAHLRARNVGGIDESEIAVDPGVTVLTGRNATNRTSLLHAFMTALGSDSASLKADADEGLAELEFDGETYVGELQRSGDDVVTSGDRFLDDPELAELFAFLLESNDARRAVATGGDLREIILRPIDTDEIEDEIDRLTAEKRDVSNELDRLESLKRDLPELERERTELESEIEDKRSELEEVRGAIEAVDTGDEARTEAEDELEETLEELSDRRSSLEDVRFDLETERESLAALREENERLADEQTGLPDESSRDVEAIDSEIERLQRRAQSVGGAVRQLQDIVQFNEEMLDGTHPEVREALSRGAEESGEVTDQLLEDESVLCWTCGTEVSRETIDETVDRMRSLQRSKLDQQNELEERVEELRSEREEIEHVRQRRRRIRNEIESITSEIDEREDRIGELEDRQSSLESEIEEIEARIDELEATVEDETGSQDEESLLELNRRANDLEFALGRLERDLEATTEEIEGIEADLESAAQLRDRRTEIRSELENLRTQIDRIERDAVESFNEQMDAILGVLDYSNLDRIWIERIEESVREGRRTVDRTRFDLHIVRSTEDGQAYEDTIDHLSESEREVTGLVFALAGYLAHEVHETVPFMLLDSLEAIDSDRISLLVEHFEEFADFLVVVLLPEDSAALPDHYERVERV